MTADARTRTFTVAVVFSAVAASAALGWLDAPLTEDPVNKLIYRTVPAACLAGLLVGLAVGVANKWMARSNDEQTTAVGRRLEPLLCAPVAGLAFATASAIRRDLDVGLATDILATWATVAVIGFLPSLIGVGLGALVGLVGGPQPKQ